MRGRGEEKSCTLQITSDNNDKKSITRKDTYYPSGTTEHHSMIALCLTARIDSLDRGKVGFITSKKD